MPTPAPPTADQTTEIGRITRPLRLSEEVSGDLQRRISRGDLKPGDRLPTEKALGEDSRRNIQTGRGWDS